MRLSWAEWLGETLRRERNRNGLRLADNVAVGTSAVQISTYLSPASAAIDGDVTTSSCTDDDAARPWWAVDLGQTYDVGRVTVTFPDQNADGECNYPSILLHSLI